MLKLTVNRVFAAPKIRLVTRPRRQPKLQIASIHQLTTNNNTFQRLPNSISKTSKRLPHNMAEPQTVKTRILIISDTHSTPLQPTTSPNPFRQPLPSADILIHCGDLTMKGLTSEYHKTLDLLASIDAPIKLVIAGNHDRTLDKTWMEKHQNHLWDGETYEEAREVWFGEKGRARREGVVMLEEGVHEVPLENGGVLTLYTSQYQPEFCDWAFPYWKHEDRYNISNVLIDAKHISANPIPSFSAKQLDVICTHGPPFKRGDITPHGNVGCPHLLKAVARAKPLIHCFGHIHEGWGAERVTWEDTPKREPQQTIQEFKDGGWEKYTKSVETVEVDNKEVMQQRAVFVDASKTGGKEVIRGEQTLMVNAAIMDAGYHPVNAAFLVDVDLPLKK
ncbi:Metallo-dependent phosphatase [Aureobasidium pullulans]|uniref:Metallo-dependent phosphatase n=1 Tax=Aureobasidium pullulans TaxID=5580 RepID=A0A4S9CWQ1_AURPU|nr:Metallo-dependent phosphatase [Aureobasidium pullulans]